MRKVLSRLYLRKMYRKNEKILNQKNRKTKHNKVNLHWWSMQRQDNKENVGDFLATIICDFMLEKKNLSFNDSVGKTAHLYSVGSIIQGGAQDAVIWGSGLKHGTSDFNFLARKTRKLDIRLVRGPETQKALIACGYNCPAKFGDPAIIMPLIYQPNVEKINEYIVILHHETTLKINDVLSPVTEGYKDFIDNLCKAKMVISSSLHGIILAEAYGIPAILLADKETNNMFKYNDYYHSTGRYDFPIVYSVEEALLTKPANLPDFTELRNNILSTFPYDLWNKKL